MDLTERDLSPLEFDLYTIRQKALSEINADTLIETYKNTNLNLIPLISGGQSKVYILTGPQVNGVVVFGNDYLISFDKDKNIFSKKALHRNIIPIQYDGKENVESSMHSHLAETGEFITATDICTLMLYGKFTKWKTHNVVSQKYLNIWDCKKNDLVVITMEAVEKIRKDQEQRRKNQ